MSSDKFLILIVGMLIGCIVCTIETHITYEMTGQINTLLSDFVCMKVK